MDNLNLTAEELKDFRRVLGWSQQQMADELAVARNTINRMEKGHMAIETRTALAVRYLAHHYRPVKSNEVLQVQPVAPVAESIEGDKHLQAELNLPELLPIKPSRFQLRQQAAESAWLVYQPVISDLSGANELSLNFRLIWTDAEANFSYLFLLQLLERLVKLHDGSISIPNLWNNLKKLRKYAFDLYQENPQWH
ncbi:helix-turn-helix transcriptional regulator [Aeromonas hydrophila]